MNRPEELEGVTFRINTGCGNLYVTINKDEHGNIFEIFCRIGKAGGCAFAQAEMAGRALSLALKHQVPLSEIIKEFKGIRCNNVGYSNGLEVLSCADAIAQVLEKSINL